MTRRAVDLFEACAGRRAGELAARGAAVTEMNAALFDARHAYKGSIAGVQHVLFGQGLLASELCLEPHECLSPGQEAEIARVRAAHPELVDDQFVAERRDAWLR